MLLQYVVLLFFVIKQKTAYEMRISDWSSDVCSSDLDFASMINTYFGGALGLWSHDNIDAAVFFAHIRHAMAISLLACGNKQWEARLIAEVAAARAVIRPLSLT